MSFFFKKERERANVNTYMINYLFYFILAQLKQKKYVFFLFTKCAKKLSEKVFKLNEAHETFFFI